MRGPVDAYKLTLTFEAQGEAEIELATIPEHTRRFYGLRVVSDPNWRKARYESGHGWMVRHPGFDLMH